jgi:Tol biopolymer transport system component
MVRTHSVWRAVRKGQQALTTLSWSRVAYRSLVVRLAAASLVASTAALPTIAAAAPSAADCGVKQARLLGQGGDQDWSAVRDLIVYDQKDAGGTHQLRTIKPNGSGDVCLSCVLAAGGPPLDRHKVNPTWHPSGKYIIVQVENTFHALSWLRDASEAELVINGMASELWAVTPDGKQWTRLTDFAGTWPAPATALGVMAPHFSPDGTRLIYSKLVTAAGLANPLGTYKLMLADFSINNGVPSLKNEQDITPMFSAPFVEAQAFSPDGNSVTFASNEAFNPFNMEIWTMDLTWRWPVKLTTSPEWDEHSMYSPDGKSIVYMATELGAGPWSGDLMIMNTDGSNKRRLTAFNQAGQPGSTGQKTMVHHVSWNANGTSLAVTEQLANNYPATRRLWVVDFNGPCGGAPVKTWFK